MGPGLEVFPIYGEVPAEGGDGARPEGLIASRHGPEP